MDTPSSEEYLHQRGYESCLKFLTQTGIATWRRSILGLVVAIPDPFLGQEPQAVAQMLLDKRGLRLPLASTAGIRLTPPYCLESSQ